MIDMIIIIDYYDYLYSEEDLQIQILKINIEIISR